MVAAAVAGIPLVTAAHASVAVRYRVTRTIPVGFDPGGVAVDSAIRTGYVANAGNDSVSLINEGAGTVFRTIWVGANPDAVAVDRGTHSAYVANWWDNSVSVITRCTC